MALICLLLHSDITNYKVMVLKIIYIYQIWSSNSLLFMLYKKNRYAIEGGVKGKI